MSLTSEIIKQQEENGNQLRFLLDQSHLIKCDLVRKISEKDEIIKKLESLLDKKDSCSFSSDSDSGFEGSQEFLENLSTSRSWVEEYDSPEIHAVEKSKLLTKIQDQKVAFRKRENQFKSEIEMYKKRIDFHLENMRKMSIKNKRLRENITVLRQDYDDLYVKHKNYKRIRCGYGEDCNSKHTLALAELHYLIGENFEELEEQSKINLKNVNEDLYLTVVNHREKIRRMRLKEKLLRKQMNSLKVSLKIKDKECDEMSNLCTKLIDKI